MYMRVTRGRFDPAATDQFSRVSQEVQAAVGRLPGFQHLHTGIDRAAGRMVAVSLWDTEEHAQQSSAAFRDIIPHLQALGVQMEPLGIYEVVAHA